MYHTSCVNGISLNTSEITESMYALMVVMLDTQKVFHDPNLMKILAEVCAYTFPAGSQ